jgi:ABC-type amino acid transport substrate-binding protein
MSRWRPKLLVALAIMLVAVLVGAGCGDDEEETTTGAAAAGEELDTLEPGVLTVGSDIPFAPFEFGRPPDYEGFDIDLVNAIAENLGVEVEIVKTPFDTIFRDLAAGNKFDMVASSTTITEERERQVDFSDPYFIGDQSILVQEGSDIQTVEDLAGQTVGVQIATTGADYAEEETDASEVRTFDLADDAVQALQAGQVAAVVIDFGLAKFAEQEEEGLVVSDTIETGEVFGLAFETGSPLIEPVNSALQEIKDDGTYARIYEEWFDEEPPPEILEPGGGAETGTTETTETDTGEAETSTDGGGE